MREKSGGGGYLSKFLLGMCRWPFRAPTLWPIIDPSLVTFGQICNFCCPNLVTFFLSICLILNEEHSTSHLQWKHSGTFANCKYEELSYITNQKICDPILVIVLKMQPYYSHYRHKNATPFSGTSPLASYKEVPPPPPDEKVQRVN